VGHLRASGITQAYFGFDWHDLAQAYTTYWTLHLAADQLSGPVTQSSPIAYHGLDYTVNWAGWEYWSSGTPALGYNTADELVPTVSVPSQTPANVPSGIYVHAVATAWLSLAASQGGANGLLQTGFSTDATQPAWSDYNLWYEYFLSSSSSQCPAYNYPGSPVTTPGDYVWEIIEAAPATHPGSFSVSAYDMEKHVGAQIWLNPGDCGLTSSWRPYFAEYIVEAYAYGENGQLVVQQIAKLSSQVAFYDEQWCNYGSFSSCYTPGLPDVSDQIYQLAQSQAFIWGQGTCGWFCNWDDNTNQVYNSGCGGYFGSCGYPTVSWVTSDFDYNVAH
jgi:hypothetical protein